MVQGDNVCREAVFEQDTPVSLAVQLSDEAVPVDHEAWAEPATQKQSAFCWNITAVAQKGSEE